MAETAKCSTFGFLDAEILPANMLVNVASSDAFHPGGAHPCPSAVAGRWLAGCRSRSAIPNPAVLAGAAGPLSAANIASRFKQGKRVERDTALTLRAYVLRGCGDARWGEELRVETRA